MQEVRSGDVETTETNESTTVVLVAEDELVLTPAAAIVLARVVRAYLDAKRAAA